MTASLKLGPGKINFSESSHMLANIGCHTNLWTIYIIPTLVKNEIGILLIEQMYHAKGNTIFGLPIHVSLNKPAVCACNELCLALGGQKSMNAEWLDSVSICQKDYTAEDYLPLRTIRIASSLYTICQISLNNISFKFGYVTTHRMTW